MSIKLSEELEARYALLTDHLLSNPNTVLKYSVLSELFGEDEAKVMTTYLGRFYDSTNGMAQGKRRKVADTEHTIYFYLDQLSVPNGRAGSFKGVLYRCAPGSYVYDPEATYRVGGGIRNNRFPIYNSASAITPPKLGAQLEQPEQPDEQLQLPFPAPQPITPVPELAETLIESDRANRAALADTPPERRRLPILPVFPTPDDPKRAQLLARGDETIVVQTATEIITATIVVAVPR